MEQHRTSKDIGGDHTQSSHALRFSTGSVPPKQQFEYWRDAINTLIEVSLPEGTESKSGYDANMTLFNLGSMVISSEKFDAVDYKLTDAALRRGNVDHWVLSLNKRGIAKTRIGDTVVENLPGRITPRSLTKAFEGSASAVDMIFVYLPRDLYPDLAPALDSLNSREISSGLSSLLADFLVMMERKLPLLSASELPAAAQATQAMIASCLAPSPDSLFAAKEEIDATLVQRIRTHIRKNLKSAELTPEKIAQAFGISRTQLYRLFERHGGGVAREIRHQRLLASHAALMDRQNQYAIFEIAKEFGFTSGDEFGRTFRNEFGYTPRDARRMHFSATSLSLPLHDRTFNSWMTSLGRAT